METDSRNVADLKLVDTTKSDSKNDKASRALKIDTEQNVLTNNSKANNINSSTIEVAKISTDNSSNFDSKKRVGELIDFVPDQKRLAQNQFLISPKIKKRRSSMHDTRLFQCQDCEKSFTQQAHLSIHQRKHTGERPYVCGFQGCSKSFTQLGNLKTHERKHTGERPFTCSHPGCDKSFSQMGNMKTHEQLHLGTRPFPCEFPGCSKAFTQLGNLKSHQAKIHGNGKRKEERKFQWIPEKSLPLRKRKLASYLEKAEDVNVGEYLDQVEEENEKEDGESSDQDSERSKEKELLQGIKARLFRQKNI